MNPKLLQAVALIALFGPDPPERPDTPVADENEDFHSHLRRCKQCADHPFALCVTGERLIKEAAEKHPPIVPLTGRAKPWEPAKQAFPGVEEFRCVSCGELIERPHYCEDCNR